MVQPAANRGSPMRLPRVVERTRLIEKLNDALKVRVTLVSAPPGYGKTTLVAQFAERSPVPVIWHAVDDTQRDVANLQMRSVSAVGEVFPRVAMRDATRGIAPAELAASLIDFLRDDVHQSIVYVLDDIHHLTGARAAESWLNAFVMGAPPNCHIILISRTIPNLPMADLIARREIQPINQAALRFTPDEIDALSRSLSSAGVDQRLGDSAFLDRLEGWAAGLVLALQPMTADWVGTEHLLNMSSETLFDAMAQTMLDAQPPSMRDFLLQSSVVGRMQPDLLNNVLQIPNARALLAEATERNLFITSVSGGLAYHGLFRDFLQKELVSRDADLFRAQHRKVAVYYEERQRIDDAVFHFLMAEAYEDTERLVELYARPYYDQGRNETLLAWNEALTARGVFNGWLLYVCAIVMIERYDYAGAAAGMRQARAWFGRHQDPDGEGAARVDLLDAHLDLLRGSLEAARLKALDVIERTTALPSIYAGALRIVGFVKLKVGQSNEAIVDLEAARALYEMHSDRYALTKLLIDLQIAYRQVGRTADASVCLQQMVAIRRELGGQVGIAYALNELGYFQHLSGDYQDAEVTLQEGLRAVAKAHDRRVEALVHWTLGDLRRDLADFDESINLYNRALECAGVNEPAIRSSVLVSLSIVRRWQNKIEDALQLADEAALLARKHDLHLEGLNATLAFYAAKGMMGQFAEALKGLQGTLAELKVMDVSMETAHALTLVAAMSHMRKEREAVIEAMDAVLQLMKDGALLQPAIAEMVYVPNLSAMIGDTSARYAPLVTRARMLRKAQVQPTNIVAFSDVAETTSRTYSLHIQTLGKQIVERDGVLVLSTEWQAARSREIFFYLLFNGPQQKERLTLEFWPDQDYQRVRQNLHTTISRGRAAIGDNVVVYRDELYAIHPDIDVWCDALVFQKLVEDSRGKPSRDVRTQELWRRAIELYQGDFLPGFDAEWVLEQRENLREMYLDALIGAGDCAQARADFSEAARYYRQAMKLDEFREDVHRALFICYAARGEKHKIKAQFDILRQLFYKELDCDLSEETIALVSNLLG